MEYLCKKILDPVELANDMEVITGFSAFRKIKGRVITPKGWMRLVGVDTKYPTANFNTDDPDPLNHFWEVIEDTTEKQRQSDIKQAIFDAKMDAVGASPRMTTEQKKLLYGVELTETEKDKIVTDFKTP